MRFVKYGVLVVLLLLPACSGGDGNQQASVFSKPAPGEQPTYGGTVFRHLTSDCRTLNWVLYTITNEDYVLRCLYDYLLDYNENMEIVPVLAESYEISDDHLKITVRLRENLKWHDGMPITTEDVKFTIDRILDPAVPAVNKEGWFDRLDRVEIVDELTVVFVWKELYAPSLHALAQLAPIPKHVYGQGDFLTNPANRAPVGSGAFKFESWKTGQTITVVRNENYYRDRAYLDRIVFKIIPDRAVALNALKTGELDEMRVRQQQWEKQTNDRDFLKRFEKISYPVPQYNYLSWNCRSVYFKDSRVRRAMTLLFDRGKINATLYSNFAELVSGPFYFKSAAYDQSIKQHPYDPEQAKTLLAEAGWTDSDGDGIRDKEGIKFEFEFYTISGNTVANQFAQLLQEAGAQVGITVNIRQYESTTYFDKVFKGEYEAAILAWRLDIDPDVYDTFHSSQVPPIGLNHAFYSNAEVDHLLEVGRVEFDQEKRNRIYHQVHQLIHEDSPYTFVNSVPEKRPINKRIGNVVISADGPFKFYPGAIYWFIKGDMVEAKR